MIRIAAVLRLDADAKDARVADALATGEADLKRVRRAGFGDRAALASAFARVDGLLVDVAREIEVFAASTETLSRARPLAAVFEVDRATFAEALGHAYATEAA